MAVWPFEAERPFLEVLEWGTDVQTARSGAEQRTAVRARPRWSVELNLVVEGQADRSMLEALAYTSHSQVSLVPWWPGRRRVGDVAAGSTSVPVNTADARFIAGAKAMLLDGTTWESVDVLSVSASALGVSAVVSSFVNAEVVPLVSCRLSRDFSRTDYPSGVARCSFSFVSDAGEAPDGGEPAELFAGVEVGPDVLSCDGAGLARAGSREYDEVDGTTGLVHRVVHSRSAASVVPVTLRASDFAEAAAIRRFLHRRRGKYSPFWLPSGVVDGVTSAATLGGESSVPVSGLFGYQLFSPSGTRRAVTFGPLADGSRVRRLVSSVGAMVGGVEVVGVSGTLPAMPAGTRVSWLTESRLNADRVELGWMGECLCVVKTQVKEVW
jgi:hypothetical protein